MKHSFPLLLLYKLPGIMPNIHKITFRKKHFEHPTLINAAIGDKPIKQTIDNITRLKNFQDRITHQAWIMPSITKSKERITWKHS